MAAPTGQFKVSRYFVVLAIILVGLYALVFLTGDKKPHPRLGLDLRGGTSMTLSAATLAGKKPTAESLNQARQIIYNRVNASGVTEAEVVTEGNNNIVVNVACKGCEDTLRKLVAPAQLFFREVKSSTSDHPVNSATPSPSTSGSAKSSGSAKPSGSVTPSTSAPASASPKASASAAATPSSSASAAGASATPSLNPSQQAAAADTAKTLADVKKKLGTTYTLGENYVGAIQSGQGQIDPNKPDENTISLLSKFSTLTPDEVASLPPVMQFYIPTVECSQLNGRAPGSISDPKQQVVACDQGADAHTKYVLDVSTVSGTDVASANSNFDSANGGWNVALKFKGGGSDRWTKLTQKAMDDGKAAGQTAGAQVAIVLDNEVVSAPAIQGVIVGDAIINGTGINENTSKVLATQLKYGALPLSFKIQSVNSVSATLGIQQLQYGLLAGGIGLVLVVLYCLLYYRALGLVVIASLLVSATLVFGSLVELGRIMGFTLSLAGIAGFIVAIGITADSFVVFFERLKDEVKEGRTMRSSVPRAWVRARRTILSADAVSFLAAAILYLLAAGAVKGFAFTLGLSTILDLLIVFMFTHPLVALLSRSATFSSPRVSGLGALRPSRAVETGGTRFGTVRTKES